MLRISLNNEFLGPQTDDVAIGLNELVQNIKRGEADGVFFSLIINLQFIKKLREYIVQAHNGYGGIDAVVLVTIEQLNPNTYKFEPYYSGQIDYNLYDLEEDRVGVNIIEGIGFQNLVLNGLEKSVNLETLSSENGT